MNTQKETMQLSTLLERAEADAVKKHDFEVAFDSIKIDNFGRVIVPDDSGLFSNATASLTMEEHAHRQLCGRVMYRSFNGGNKSLPHDFLWTTLHDFNYGFGAYPDAYVHFMRKALESSPNKSDLLIRAYDEQTELFRGYKGRAVLSGTYAPIDNAFILRSLHDMLQDSGQGVRIIEPRYYSGTYMSRDELYFKGVLKEYEAPRGNAPRDKHYGFGVAIRNSEVGLGKVRVNLLVKDFGCDNALRIPGRAANGSEIIGLERVHRGDSEAIKTLIIAAIADVISYTLDDDNGIFERLVSRYSKPIDLTKTLDKIFESQGTRLGWKDETKTSILIGTEGSRTWGGLIDGLTYAAQGMNIDERFETEGFAGELLMADQYYRDYAVIPRT